MSLRPTTPCNGAPRSHLLHDGTDTGVTIDGALLEAALKASAGYLLFVTDDVPF